MAITRIVIIIIIITNETIFPLAEPVQGTSHFLGAIFGGHANGAKLFKTEVGSIALIKGGPVLAQPS